MRRSHDDVADLLLGLHFDGAVVPFHHVADAPPLGVGHRVDDLAHDMPADRDLRAMGAVEPAEQVALVRRVLVEDVDVAADQRLGVEVGQVAAHVLFGLAQHLHQRPVDVDDVQVGVGDHHAGGDIVQRGADAQVLGGTVAVLPGTGLELDDHLADRGVHLPDLVARAVVHPHVEVAVRDRLDRTERTGQRAQDGAGDQPARQQRRQQYQHAGKDQHPAEAPGARGDVVGVFAAADDPAPALVQADVGDLLHRALDPGLGPGVVEEAAAIALRKPDHLHEDLLAVGTGGVAEVLAVQRGLVRMHQHRGVLVVHPQVVAAVGAAQRLDGRQCLAAGLVLAQFAGGGAVGIAVGQCQRCFHAGMQGAALVAQQLVVVAPGRDQAQGDDPGCQDRQHQYEFPTQRQVAEDAQGGVGVHAAVSFSVTVHGRTGPAARATTWPPAFPRYRRHVPRLQPW